MLATRRTISEKEYLVNALEMVEEAVINDLDLEEKSGLSFIWGKVIQAIPKQSIGKNTLYEHLMV